MKDGEDKGVDRSKGVEEGRNLNSGNAGVMKTPATREKRQASRDSATVQPPGGQEEDLGKGDNERDMPHDKRDARPDAEHRDEVERLDVKH